MKLTGIHHLTAVSADIRSNYKFYTQVMGMRLVKRSVNQDDVSAYHLFYADAVGHPGTDLTFFDWKMPRERRGTRSLTRTGLRVSGESALDYWLERFDEKGITHTEARRVGLITSSAISARVGVCGARFTDATRKVGGRLRVDLQNSLSRSQSSPSVSKRRIVAAKCSSPS